uniref:RNA-directed RNA polymerase n=1 Tax=Uromyces fabae virus TaxID=3069272 RepID=A0AA51UCV2_9VIRU|nr:RNA-dependent RNA polymerase [Uromyces fabae virus]
MLVSSEHLWVGDYGQVFEKLKDVSVVLKALHCRGLPDLTPMFELQTLVNRGYGAVDWAAERSHRLKPDVVHVDPKKVYEGARKVFRMGTDHGYKYKKMKLDDFIAARWEWSPSGSVHSQHQSDSLYIPKDDYRHRTKFATLNSMGSEYIKTFFDRRPEVHAWASTKYEWGKQRAIYGVDLTSATVAHYAMYNCEHVFRHRFPVGEEAESGRVHRRLKEMLEGRESFCYDFDDFNAQHSTASMVAVLMAFKDQFVGDMDEDQVKAMDWVIDSQTNVTVHDNDGQTYKARGTLMSGSRLTTFINTVLNYVYMDLAGVLSLRGVVDSVHNGDDVLLAVNDYATAVEVHKRMAAINARAQAAKCNVYSVGEFLRVEHKLEMEDGLGAQYLSRSCATFTYSRIESQAPVRLTDAVSATQSRTTDLIRRAPHSKELVSALVVKIMDKIANVFSVTKEAVEMFFSTHVVAGGVSEERWASVANHIYEEVAPEEDDVGYLDKPDEAVTVSTLYPGVLDYVRIMYRKMRGVVGEDLIFTAVCRATRNQLAVTRKCVVKQRRTTSESEFGYARALYRMWKGKFRLPYIAKSRFLGVPPVALATS